MSAYHLTGLTLEILSNRCKIIWGDGPFYIYIISSEDEFHSIVRNKN